MNNYQNCSKYGSVNLAMIKIGNIPWDISTCDVVELIDPFLIKYKPNQDWVHIPMDKVTGKTLSELYVEIPTITEAQNICINLDKHILKQRALSVSLSDYSELFSVLIKREAIYTHEYINAEEASKILDICKNYKVSSNIF